MKIFIFFAQVYVALHEFINLTNMTSDLFCTSSTLMLFSSSSLKPGTSTTNTCPPSVPSSSSSPDECARTAVTRVTLGGALSHHKRAKMKSASDLFSTPVMLRLDTGSTVRLDCWLIFRSYTLFSSNAL